MTTKVVDSTISNSLQLFADKGFKLRVIMRLGNPWFVAPDACGCLALSNVSEALADLDDDDKLKLTKGELDTLISNEGIKCSVLLSGCDVRMCRLSQTKSRSALKPLEKSRGFLFVVSMVLFSRHHFTCDISHTCREGREVKRPETSKKVERTP